MAHASRLPVFVVVSAALGIGAHGAAQRMLPDARLMVVAVVAVTAIGVLLCRRRRSFETIAAALIAGQSLVHVVLCLDHLAQAPAPVVTGHHRVAAGGAIADGVLAQLTPDATMLLAHLLAAGVAAWWLARGEAAVWAAAGRWLLPAILDDRALVPTGRQRPIRAVARPLPLHDQVFARACPLRGPPAARPAFA